MFTELKPLVTVCVMLFAISDGLAEDLKSVAASQAGTAYEFSGLTKYFTVSSKYLFGNKELLSSAIVDGYRVDLTNSEWDCIKKSPEKIVLTSNPVGWWSQPIYSEVLTDQSVPKEAIVFFSTSLGGLREIGCTQDISAEEFVVDEIIAQKLLAKKGSTLDEK